MTQAEAVLVDAVRTPQGKKDGGLAETYPEDLVAKGRDIECLTLARAVALHVERRVFLHAKRTVVFDR